MKQSREEVALVISDTGELLGLLRRHTVDDAADKEPLLPVRHLPRESLYRAEPVEAESERWKVAFAELDPAASRLT